MAHAVKTIRQLARRQRETPPAEVSEKLANIDAQIAKLERLVRERSLTPAVAAPALAKPRSERQAALRTASPRVARAPESFVFEAEAAFRETVSRMAKVLRGDYLIEARELLREIVGAIRLEPESEHLIAKFERSEIPLLATANGTWIGSGGVIANGGLPAIPLRRKAS